MAAALALSPQGLAAATRREAVFMTISTATDPVILKQANKDTEEFVQTDEAPAILFHILRTSQHEHCRQTAAVLLRKRIVKFWKKSKVGSARCKEIQAAIIHLLTIERSRLVRNAVIPLAALVGKTLLPDNRWPELAQLLSATLVDSNPDVRELGMLLLAELSRVLGSDIEGLAPAMKGPLLAGLQDTSARVRQAATDTLLALLENVEGEEVHELYADCFGPLMALTQSYLGMGGAGSSQDSDETLACHVLELLASLLQAGSPITEPHVLPVQQAMLAILANSELESSTRESAGAVLCSCWHERRSVLTKTKGLLETLIHALATLMQGYNAQAEKDREAAAQRAGLSNNELAGEDDIADSAEVWLQLLAKDVREKPLFRAFITTLQPWFAPTQGSATKRAALRSLAAIAHDCTSTLQEYLPQVLALVTPLSADPDPVVRGACAYCLAHLSEAGLPRITQFHADMMPCIIKLLEDPFPSVARWAAHVSESFCEDLSREAIAPYTPPLLAALSRLMAMDNMACKEAVLPALSSVALAAEAAFLPYLPPVSESLLTLMGQTEAALLPIRAKATECMGHISSGVGTEAFAPYFQRALAHAIAGYSLSNAELKCACLMFLASSAESSAGEPAFQQVVPQLLPMCSGIVLSEGMMLSPAEIGATIGPAPAAGSGALQVDDDEDDDEDEDYDPDEEEEAGQGGRRHRAGPQEEEEEDDVIGAISLDNAEKLRQMESELRCTALSCMAHVLYYCEAPALLAPHMEACTRAIQEGMVDKIDDDVKTEAIKGVHGLMRGLNRVHPPLCDAASGALLALAPAVSVVWDNLAAKLVRAVKKDRSKVVACTACDAWTRLCKSLGPVAVRQEAVHGGLMEGLTAILREEAPCQAEDEGQGHEGEGSEEEEEEQQGARHSSSRGGKQGKAPVEEGGEEDADAAHDGSILDDAIDALCDVAKVMGPAFVAAGYLQQVMPLLEKYSRPSRPVTDQLAALGACSDLLSCLPPEAMAPYAEGLRVKLMAAVGGGYRDLQRNSAYGLGMLVHRLPGPMKAHVPAILSALQPLFSLRRGVQTDDAVIDNAAGAVCRILTAMPELAARKGLGALPAVLSVLPLRDDREEDAAVYSTLLSSAASAHADAVEALPAILAACSAAAAPGSPVSVTSTVIVPGLRAVRAALPADMLRAAFSALTPAQQGVLAPLLQ